MHRYYVFFNAETSKVRVHTEHFYCFNIQFFIASAFLIKPSFTPDLYQCNVSTNGLSDIPRMMSDDKREMGKVHWGDFLWG